MKRNKYKKPRKQQLSSYEEKNPFENSMTFERKLRGYSFQQVDSYIFALTEEYNRMYAELKNLEDECGVLKERNKVLEKNATAISDTLIFAQVEANRIVEIAEERARTVSQSAEYRLTTVTQSVAAVTYIPEPTINAAIVASESEPDFEETPSWEDMSLEELLARFDVGIEKVGG